MSRSVQTPQVALPALRPRHSWLLRGSALGLVYGLLLSAGSLLCLGPGDGTYMPYAWCSAPLFLISHKLALFLSPLYWSFCGLCATLKRPRGLVLLLVTQYGAGIVGISDSEVYNSAKLTEAILLVAPLAAVYAVGQIAFWRIISRKLKLLTETQ